MKVSVKVGEGYWFWIRLERDGGFGSLEAWSHEFSGDLQLFLILLFCRL